MNEASKMCISQSKLNVEEKQRSNLFSWKGQFTPEFVSYILGQYAKECDTIADPFSGSGTVAIESLTQNMNCITYEINPSAYYMTSFYSYCKLSHSERLALVDNITEWITPIISNILPSVPVYIKEETNYREAYFNLLSLAKSIASKTKDKFILPFIINVLFLCEKDKKLTLRDSFRNNYKKIRDLLFSLPYSIANFIPHLSDARLFGYENPDSVDLVLTSPPYINVFNYHQNYRGIIECFNFDILKIANSEIGSNRKNRINRFRTVVEYAIEMGAVLNNSCICLKNKGKAIFVVGRESMVRKTRFYNSKIIYELINSIPGLSIQDCMERKFTNRYGEEIFEDIIVAEKQNDILGSSENFMQIGLTHIQDAIQYANECVKPDLLSILQNPSSIHTSSIYK